MHQKPSFRTERVAEEIRKVVSATLLGIRTPGFVTVTRVKVSPNLAEAWVYYSVFGEDAVCEQTNAVLKTQKSQLRRELGYQLKLRKTPEIYLVADETPKKAAEISHILNELNEQ